MEDLMCRDRTFCQCFFRRDTRKLIDRCTFCTNSSGVISTCPTATDKQSTWIAKNIFQHINYRIGNEFSGKFPRWENIFDSIKISER